MKENAMLWIPHLGRKSAMHKCVQSFPKKKNSWKTRSKFFIFLGLVFISQNLIMKWTRTLGWWKTCFKKWSKFLIFFCPTFFNFLRKKTLQRMKKKFTKICKCAMKKRLRNFCSHYNDSRITSPPPLVFFLCKIDEITKLDDEQKNLL